MQGLKVVARTFEVDSNNKPMSYGDLNKDMTILSGKAAGVCYMPDDYLSDGIQNIEKALKRAEGNSASGHHSVFDHGHVTFVLKTNKMMAMILNSLGVYTTSEKSARYTKMQPETKMEGILYEKWKTKIGELILDKYPDMDDTLLYTRFKNYLVKLENTEKDVPNIKNGELINCNEDRRAEFEIKLAELKESDTLPSDKLAQENARYMISVFTPTVMEYTVSYRQIYMIIDKLTRLSVDCQHAEDKFSKALEKYVTELWYLFDRLIQDSPVELVDTKNQYIRFLEAQHVGELVGASNRHYVPYTDLENRLEPKSDYLGDSYTVTYVGSLAMLAQAQRHRTLRYTMRLKDTSDYGFYVPKIVEDAGLSKEWLEDIKSVDYCFPQGTRVRITEQGLFEDFALKCKERMCGRAQLEIMVQTDTILNQFADSKDLLSYTNRKLLEGLLDSNNKPTTRCAYADFTCSEGCSWGAVNALNRLV